MAEVKISELTNKGTFLEDTDLFIISKSDGSGGYDSKYLTGTELRQLELNKEGASYVLVLADANRLVEMENGSANNLTIPPNSSVAFPVGTIIYISQLGAGQTTVVAGSGVTLRSAGGKTKLSVQYSMGRLIKRGTDEWYLSGDITT
jgi:hypothetical protein